jgi:RND family efflux transporter MFP subunit
MLHKLDPKPTGARSRRRIGIAVTLMASAALASAVVTLSKPADAAAPASIAEIDPLPATALTVEVISPRQVSMARKLSASGSVQARDELLIGSDATGVRLLEVKVDVGAVVRRGQLLARGDDTQLLALIAQQDALVRQARAEFSQAQANLERAENLRDSGVFSVEVAQTRRTAADAAAARLDLAQAQRQELDVRLAHTRVLAPAGGVISRRSATVGAVMQPGIELFRLIRDGEIEWRAELPDHALEAVKPGAPVSVRIDDTVSVEGRVRLVAPTVDPHTRNGVVHVSLPTFTSGTPLRAGGYAQGEIQTGSAALWALPEAVLLSRDGQPFVYVIGTSGVARATPVQTGARHDGWVEVRGLAPGALVVSNGAGFVKDGERVRVANLKANQAAGTEGARS